MHFPLTKIHLSGAKGNGNPRTLQNHVTTCDHNSPAPNMTDGLLVFAQLAMAAMTTETCDNV